MGLLALVFTFSEASGSQSLFGLSVREVHCDAPAETEWEKLAQNLQLKVGLQSDPPPKVRNWTGFAKKNSFFSLTKSMGKKFYLHITECSHTVIPRSDEVMKF